MLLFNIWQKLINFKKPYRVLNWVKPSSNNLVHNYNLFQNQKPDFNILPVLKSNAYGHGLQDIAKILLKLKPKYLVVDGYFEALKIRKIDQNQPVLIMGSIALENYLFLKTKNFTFVVHDLESISALRARKEKIKIHLELNTGMNRHGIDPDEIEKYLKYIKMYSNLNLEGVMSHLADADNPNDQGYNQHQTKLFDETVNKIISFGFDLKYIHLAQSAGSQKILSKFANSIRLGLGLYGINPLDSDDVCSSNLQDLKPVLSLHSTITKIIELKKGEKVSYNGIFQAKEDTRVAVVPLGYYEGFDRILSNQVQVKHINETENSQKINFVKVAGRICMNHAIIELGGLPAKCGDEVIIYSNQRRDANSLQNLWKTYQLFPYSTLVHINENIRRVTI